MIDSTTANWAQIVDAIVRGDAPRRPAVRIGRTPALLQRYGLTPADLTMSVGKIALCRREHPEVTRHIWHRLPDLLGQPLAIIPSIRRDGMLVVVLVVNDIDGEPVVVPIAPGRDGTANAVLSVYGKSDGLRWLRAQIGRAASDGLTYYVEKGFAASMPQPGSAEAIPSSPGPIPADGTTKPSRKILTVAEKSTGS